MLILAQLKKALDLPAGIFSKVRDGSKLHLITFKKNRNFQLLSFVKGGQHFPSVTWTSSSNHPPPRFFPKQNTWDPNQAPPPSAETEAPVPKKPQARIHGHQRRCFALLKRETLLQKHPENNKKDRIQYINSNGENDDLWENDAKAIFCIVRIHRHSNVHSFSPWRLVWQENSPNVTNWGSLPLWPLLVLEVLLFLPTSATKNHNLVLYVAPTVKYNGALTMYTPMGYLGNSSWPLVWMDLF